MKRILHHIRMQPPRFRMMVAVVAALIATIVIGILWGVTLAHTRQPADVAPAPSPFSALVNTVKDTIANSKEDHSSAQNQNNPVQVIDAGASHDETNPASDAQPQ